MQSRAFQKIHSKIDKITKATITLTASDVGNEEMAWVDDRLAQVVKINGDNVTLQIFVGTEGISTEAQVVFLGKPQTLKVSEDLAGRFFDAYGNPIDGLALIHI